MKFKARDKLVVRHEGNYLEGFVLQVSDEEEVLYVVLSGQNQQPELVSFSQCQLLTPETQELIKPPKKKRGRPKKDKNE